MAEYKLMEGNEAIAEAAIRSGVDAYFGYPITPQSEILEYLTEHAPKRRKDMVVLQAESEVSAISMVYGAACTGKKTMTSSSSPGISLKQEGISYLAGAELPCLIVNVVRGGPGLGTIQPSQADYFQSTRGGGHGDYRLIVLAPSSVQEMADFVTLGFDLAFKYRMPAMILADGLIGQMMEKVKFNDPVPPFIEFDQTWATTGKTSDRERNYITTLLLDPLEMEQHNLKLYAKYKALCENDVRYEKVQCDDAEFLLVAYGSSARICLKTVQMARKKGIKVGLLRPITVSPFPEKILLEMAPSLKGILSVEMSTGQMVEDVRLSVRDTVPVEHFGRMGGVIHTPEEILQQLKERFL